jgi:hypothetical protein
VVRPGSASIEEQVHCTVRYGEGRLVNFYHGFTQAARMDRQQLRLLFERGEVTLDEWVPTRVHLHAIADEGDTRTLCELFPGARLDVTTTYSPADRACSARHKRLDVSQLLELTDGLGEQKTHRYGELLRAMMADQLAWVRDRGHARTITDENGRASLAMALAADELAHGS